MASWAKARLTLLVINWQELASLEAVHEEEFEMMQGLINGLERILVAEAWKDWKYDLGIRDVETEEFGVIKEGVN